MARREEKESPKHSPSSCAPEPLPICADLLFDVHMEAGLVQGADQLGRFVVAWDVETVVLGLGGVASNTRAFFDGVLDGLRTGTPEVMKAGKGQPENFALIRPAVAGERHRLV